MRDETYLVVGRQPWNRRHFEELLAEAAGDWRFVATPEELAAAVGSGEAFRYVFFLHWSERVPNDLLERFECVCFHMTDVPYGRGGSPLQNLIVRGQRETKLTALRMVERFDAGPVYLKRPLSLEGSSAEEVFLRASRLSCQMALEIACEKPDPAEQEGEVTEFPRRKAGESRLPVDFGNEEAIHDFIRMLDAEGYPKAFLEVGGLRFEFSRSALYDGEVRADVKITVTGSPDERSGADGEP